MALCTLPESNDIESGVTHVVGELHGDIDHTHALELAVSPSGEIYAVDNNNLYSVDLETMTLTEIGRHNISHYPSYDMSAITFTPDGTLYMFDTAGQISRINLETGQGTSVGSLEDHGYENVLSEGFVWHEGAFYGMTGELVHNEEDDTLTIEDRFLLKIELTESGLSVTEPSAEHTQFAYIDTLVSLDGELVGVVDNGQTIILDTDTGGVKVMVLLLIWKE